MSENGNILFDIEPEEEPIEPVAEVEVEEKPKTKLRHSGWRNVSIGKPGP